MKHLVFYDGKCGLCDGVVQFLLRVDSKERFVFAPLGGRHAKRLIGEESSSIALVEDFEEEGKHPPLFAGKAALRILWLLGGPWRLVGWVYFLPRLFYEWAYRFIARHRYRFFGKTECVIPSKSHRFID